MCIYIHVYIYMYIYMYIYIYMHMWHVVLHPFGSYANAMPNKGAKHVNRGAPKPAP